MFLFSNTSILVNNDASYQFYCSNIYQDIWNNIATAVTDIPFGLLALIFCFQIGLNSWSVTRGEAIKRKLLENNKTSSHFIMPVSKVRASQIIAQFTLITKQSTCKVVLKASRSAIAFEKLPTTISLKIISITKVLSWN